MAQSLTSIAHERVGAALAESPSAAGAAGLSAIDATAGNGHDTLFLARKVGTAGRIMAIDLQSAAIEQTRMRLQNSDLLERVSLIAGDHRYLRDFAQQLNLGTITAIMFNLGYHPGGNRALTTSPESTLLAVEAALDLLSSSGSGILSIMAYRGHPGGKQETTAVQEFLHSRQGTSSPHGGTALAVEVIDSGSNMGPVLYVVNLNS